MKLGDICTVRTRINCNYCKTGDIVILTHIAQTMVSGRNLNTGSLNHFFKRELEVLCK